MISLKERLYKLAFSEVNLYYFCSIDSATLDRVYSYAGSPALNIGYSGLRTIHQSFLSSFEGTHV